MKFLERGGSGANFFLALADILKRLSYFACELFKGRRCFSVKIN